jgi:integrase/recombinase XerD
MHTIGVPDSLPDLAAEVPLWKRAMRSAGKSEKTITTYTMGVSRFLRWCADTGTPPELTKANAQAWVADLLDRGAQSTTATTWLGGLKRFGAPNLNRRPLISMAITRT